MPPHSFSITQFLSTSLALGGAGAVFSAAGHPRVGVALAIFSGIMGAIVVVSFIGSRLLRWIL